MTPALLKILKDRIRGEIFSDNTMRLLYATDASAYREVPLGVILPVNKQDIRHIINFVREHELSVIPRAAGTSLAGQVVGRGVVVDISRHMNRILELNTKEHWVRIEPGVVLDELNMFLAPHGLFFGPETSTSNRCMMAGMVGNNSCGSHSILYGSTRDHLLEVEAILSDGSDVVFRALDKNEFEQKLKEKSLEGDIYRHLYALLSDPANQEEIKNQYPHPDIHRRNTGYALDYLLDTDPFTGNGKPFNLCRILAGSEGTLAFTTGLKLNLVPVPPPVKGLVCVHLEKPEDAFKANLIALKHLPGAVEMMDKTVLDLTKDNITQRKNRFFIKGDPGALLLVEFARETRQEIEQISRALVKDMRAADYGYHFPVLYGSDVNKVWDLRKAGLGVLANMKGDAKPVPVIEDTAVRVEDLPAYMEDFRKILERHNKSCVYYAHIGTGELHLRPVLNLKDPEDVELFHTLGLEVARLVKKYHGSLSGEHGDGRLRGEFIPIMYGDHIYDLFRQVKHTWDPHDLFNPGKITDTPVMNTYLRFQPGQHIPKVKTYFDFSESNGFLGAAEKCNGSGDCRKSSVIGGLMCPSYMATRDEDKTTRARANILRETITNSQQKNPFDDPGLYKILDLCLSCKGCKSECPSSVDMTRLKAEFLQHYYNAKGIPLRTRLVAWFPSIEKTGSLWPSFYNFFASNRFFSGLIKKATGFSRERTLPLLARQTFSGWLRKNRQWLSDPDAKSTVCLFIDEFTHYEDVETGKKAVWLLHALHYNIIPITGIVSGRTFLSKGLVKKAVKIIRRNIRKIHEITGDHRPLIGLEPSAILSFRDEYPDLAGTDLRKKADEIARNTFLLDEFLSGEMDAGKITSAAFTDKPLSVKVHGHCHQKALSSTQYTVKMLSFPENYTVEEIPSGCCGMAGAFGYEKEHYKLSMDIGELVLFPAIRQTAHGVVIAAPGTSCRHQIKDGTSRDAYHPVDILYDALKHKPQVKI
ncbi:MAG: FAD-binding protein [Chlorobi bacterium]|nr:FAD-binding protein [Chlorobiota bacterium]